MKTMVISSRSKILDLKKMKLKKFDKEATKIIPMQPRLEIEL
jgi:hypothetical protein